MSEQTIERLREIVARVTAPQVLLVEDDPNDAELTTRVLGEEGLKIAIAPTAAAALDELHKNCFCLCLLDLKLPDCGDPLDLIQQFKKLRPFMEIVVLTGTLHSESLRQALEKSVLAVLLKPIKAEQLKGVHFA